MSIVKKSSLFSLVVAAVALIPSTVWAQAHEAAAKAGSNDNDVVMWATIGAGLAIGLGVFGGATGQGRAAAAALEGIARNPGAAGKIQTPMILALALMESLVLLAFVVALFIVGVIPGRH